MRKKEEVREENEERGGGGGGGEEDEKKKKKKTAAPREELEREEGETNNTPIENHPQETFTGLSRLGHGDSLTATPTAWGSSVGGLWPLGGGPLSRGTNKKINVEQVSFRVRDKREVESEERRLID